MSRLAKMRSTSTRMAPSTWPQLFERLDAQVRELREQLAASEADRAARLDVIRRLDTELTEARTEFANQMEKLMDKILRQEAIIYKLRADLADTLVGHFGKARHTLK